MNRLLAALLLTLLAGAGCARHFVVQRVGRVDSARSISSMSDEQWTLHQEPAARVPEDEGEDP